MVKKTLTPLNRKRGQSITMSFPDAMRQVIDGKRITRLEWANKDYCFLKGEWLTIFTKGKFHTWLINDGDLEAQDWYVVREVN